MIVRRERLEFEVEAEFSLGIWADLRCADDVSDIAASHEFHHVACAACIVAIENADRVQVRDRVARGNRQTQVAEFSRPRDPRDRIRGRSPFPLDRVIIAGLFADEFAGGVNAGAGHRGARIGENCSV